MKFKSKVSLFLLLFLGWSVLKSQEIRNSNLIWTLSAENTLVIDSLHKSNKLAGTNLFNSVIEAVKEGKLKLDSQITTLKFDKDEGNILTYWDSSDITSENYDGMYPAPVKMLVYPELLSGYSGFIRLLSIIRFSKSGRDISPFKYFSIIKRAIGPAYNEPAPAFSICIPIAIFG